MCKNKDDVSIEVRQNLAKYSRMQVAVAGNKLTNCRFTKGLYESFFIKKEKVVESGGVLLLNMELKPAINRVSCRSPHPGRTKALDRSRKRIPFPALKSAAVVHENGAVIVLGENIGRVPRLPDGLIH